MTGAEVLDVARDSIMTLVLVSSPLMLVGLAIGVAISLFQALTQIQEMTLVFVHRRHGHAGARSRRGRRGGGAGVRARAGADRGDPAVASERLYGRRPG